MHKIHCKHWYQYQNQLHVRLSLDILRYVSWAALYKKKRVILCLKFKTQIKLVTLKVRFFFLLKAKETSSDISAVFGLFPRTGTNEDVDDAGKLITHKTDWFCKAQEARGRGGHLQPGHTLLRLCGRQNDKQPLSPVSFNQMMHWQQGQRGWSEPCDADFFIWEGSTFKPLTPSLSHIQQSPTQ